ncbi:MAG: hypothetical protein RLZ97_634, partial [Verrucomicrobiota bacterium]
MAGSEIRADATVHGEDAFVETDPAAAQVALVLGPVATQQSSLPGGFLI